MTVKLGISRFIIQNADIFFAQEFKFPISNENGIKYFCLDDLILNNNKIDYFMSSFELASFSKYLKDSKKSKVIFFVNNPIYLSEIEVLIKVLKDKYMMKNIDFSINQKTMSLSCNIGYSVE